MKKIFLLAFVAIFGFYSAGSVNWYPYIDQPPCSTNPDQTAWGSPIEFKLCFEQPCNKCCFTIIYFDRWIGGNPPPINEIFVAGIFHDGNSCCGYYSDAAVVDEFFKQLFYNKSKDNNDFYNQVTYGGMHTAWLSVKGKCVVSEESCGTICCGTPIELNFETIDDIHTVTSINIQNGAGLHFPECNPQIENCLPDCAVHNKGVEPLLCTLPCNPNNWGNPQEQVIDLIGCSGCQIRFFYQKRTANCPPDEYNDYRILSGWEKINCSACSTFIEEDYLGQIVSWLLYNGGLPMPTVHGEIGCITNYRVINSLCWKFINNRAEYCDETKCCIKLYKICLELNPLTETWEPRWYDITEEENNEQCTSPCIKLCSPPAY